jgi:hypothetical protein
LNGELAPGRSRAALGIGAIFGALVAVPALARLTGSGIGLGAAFLALAGGGALLLGPVLALLGRAQAGGSRLSFVIAGVALAALPVARFGSVLHATTHHRPLGAATFAIGSLAVVLGCLLVAYRVAALDRQGVRRIAAFGLFGAAAMSSGAVLFTALRAEGLRSHVVDAVLLVGGAGLGWVVLGRPALVRSLARVGLVLWTLLVLGHLFAVTRPGFDQVRDRAPVLSGPVGWLKGS